MKHPITTLLALIPAASFAAPAAIGELVVCPDYENIVGRQSRVSLRADNDIPTDFETRVLAALARGEAAPSQAGATAGTAAAALAQTGSAVAPSSTCTHTIIQGDTLSDLANRYLLDPRRWREIAAANPSVDPNVLRVGTVLSIPCGASGAGGSVPPFGSSAPSQTVTAPQTVPEPVWTAANGASFTDVVEAWAARAGYRVVVETQESWTLGVPVSITGDFEAALEELVRGLGSAGRPPAVLIYANNVVRIG